MIFLLKHLLLKNVVENKVVENKFENTLDTVSCRFILLIL